MTEIRYYYYKSLFRDIFKDINGESGECSLSQI
jgi:hypothetical protein